MYPLRHQYQFKFSFPSSSFSTINDLPIELLSYIFSLSTFPGGFPGPEEVLEVEEGEEGEECRPPTITTESVQVPLVLSSVNRLWRQVALGTPQLWSSLCITVELVERDSRFGLGCMKKTRRGSSRSESLNTEHITSYLSLSRKYPLNILIDARDENWNFEPECVLIPFHYHSFFLLLVIMTDTFLKMEKNHTHPYSLPNTCPSSFLSSFLIYLDGNHSASSLIVGHRCILR